MSLFILDQPRSVFSLYIAFLYVSIHLWDETVRSIEYFHFRMDSCSSTHTGHEESCIRWIVLGIFDLFYKRVKEVANRRGDTWDVITLYSSLYRRLTFQKTISRFWFALVSQQKSSRLLASSCFLSVYFADRRHTRWVSNGRINEIRISRVDLLKHEFLRTYDLLKIAYLGIFGVADSNLNSQFRNSK